MFGMNEITKPFSDGPGDTFLVNDIFYTIQGEGPDAGRPAIFIRLAKCNLRCYFCDTEFEQFITMTTDGVIARVLELSQIHKCRLAVITGGEPLLQNIFWLVTRLNVAQVTVTVETAGTVWVNDLDILFKVRRESSPYQNALICSPKTGRLEPRLAKIVHALKYIINEGETSKEDGLPVKSTQLQGTPLTIARPNQCPYADVYVQAQDTGNDERSARNLVLAATIAMQYGYRLSVQLHKLAQLP